MKRNKRKISDYEIPIVINCNGFKLIERLRVKRKQAWMFVKDLIEALYVWAKCRHKALSYICGRECVDCQSDNLMVGL